MRVLNVLLVAGLSVVWPIAASASSPVQQIDKSPAASVVARAPRAVSVTFDTALSSNGASMRIWGPDGEVSSAQPQVVGNAVRRTIDDSVPKGKYTVIWTAQGTDGQEVRGSFSFTAASGTGSYAIAEPVATSAQPEPVTAVPQVPSVSGPEAGSRSARSARFLVVPILLAALLVLASGAVGLINGARRRPSLMPSFRVRRLALPWQRHQT